MRGKMRITFLLSGLLVCAGFLFAQTEPQEADAAAKGFMPPDGKANLYVSRDSGSFGKLIQFKLIVDDREVGSLAAGTFILVVVGPGKHSIKVVSATNTEKADLEATAGKNYFFEVKAVPGFPSAKVSMSKVLVEALGKLMITQGKLVVTSVQ